MIQTWKYLHNQNPGGEKLFKRSEEQHARSSRHTTKPWNICVPNSRLDIRKNFYTSRCVGRWNGLPHEVQNAEELNGFKNSYDDFSCWREVLFKPDYTLRSWVAQFTKFVIFKINLFQSLTELPMDTIFYILHIVYLRIIFHLTI